MLLGPPGSGKGTQGRLLAARCGVPHIASGAILRRIVATEDSELAREARVIHEGQMIPDRVANAVALRELDKPDAAGGFVLDGYPRDVPQAEALQGYLDGRSQRLDAVIVLEIRGESLIARLAGRLTCPNCGESYHVEHAPPARPGLCDRCGHALRVREDDQPERVRTRLALYGQNTEPLVAYYEARGLLRPVDGSLDVDQVFAQVARAAGLDGLSGGAGEALV